MHPHMYANVTSSHRDPQSSVHISTLVRSHRTDIDTHKPIMCTYRQACADLSMHIDTCTHSVIQIHTLSNTKVTSVDEYCELSGFADVHLFPALVSKVLSRLLARLCEAGEELQSPHSFVRQKSKSSPGLCRSPTTGLLMPCL